MTDTVVLPPVCEPTLDPLVAMAGKVIDELDAVTRVNPIRRHDWSDLSFESTRLREATALIMTWTDPRSVVWEPVVNACGSVTVQVVDLDSADQRLLCRVSTSFSATEQEQVAQAIASYPRLAQASERALQSLIELQNYPFADVDVSAEIEDLARALRVEINLTTP